MSDDHFPRAFLERCCQTEGVRRFAERLAKASRERMRLHQIARGVLIDPIDDHIDEAEGGASRHSRSIRWAERTDREEWRAGKFGRERSRFPHVFTGRAYVDERGIDQ